MIFTVTTEDPKEAKRLAKATDMAIVLFEFRHNAMRAFKHRDMAGTAEELMEIFNDLMEEQGIILEDLID